MKSKKRVMLLAGLIVGFMFFQLVSAQSWGIDLRQGSEQIINWAVDIFEPFLQAILGGQDYSGLLLFERLLVFIIIMSIVYVAIKNISVFEDYPTITILISAIVPLISVRYMDFVWLNTILISYQLMGIVVAGFLPFIIYLFFIHNLSENPTFRKIGWIFFIVVYFGLWATNETENYAQIYFWTMLIAFVFLLLDGTIHHYMEREKWREAGKEAIKKRIASLDKDIKDIRSSTSLTDREKRRSIRKLEKEIRDMRRHEGKVA